MIGQTISHYRVLEPIGAGGMGVVYKAEDIKLSRHVALKFLPADRTNDRPAVERFLREARTASALNHPNICTIYEIDDHDGVQFIAMELLQGQPLDRLIDGRPLDVTVTLDLGMQIADALDAAHSHGILHRDIKPANIFVTLRNQVKVLDFGLAKLTSTERQVSELSGAVTRLQSEMLSTKQGVALGTIAYMSPEQARGEDLDFRTDLFSFGVVLYEMATGHRTFPGGTSAVVFDAILNREPRAPIELNANVPADLERIIAKALEKDRVLRYQSAAEIRADLQRIKRERESGSTAVTKSAVAAAVPVSSGSNWPSTASKKPSGSSWPSAVSGQAAAAPKSGASFAVKKPAVLAAAGVGVLALVGGGIFLMQGRNQPDQAAQSAVADASQPAAVPAATPGDPGTPAGGSVAPATPQPQAVAPAPPAVTTPPSASPQAATGATGSAATSATAPPAAGRTGASTSPTAGRAGAPPAAAAGKAGTGTPTPARGATAAAAAATAAAPVVAAIPEPPRALIDSSGDELRVARAKFEAKLYDQALADVKATISHTPSGPNTPLAYLLMGEIHDRAGRPEEAMATYVELRSKFSSSPAIAEATFQLADLMTRSKQRDREANARDLFGEVAKTYGQSPWAPRALFRKAGLEERANLKVMDSQLGTQVPAALVTYRALVEGYPEAEGVAASLEKLARMYDDLRRYELSAQALQSLATKFPNNSGDAAWRAAELYDKRLRDKDRARAAYALVPQRSSHYREAQERMQQK